MNDCEHLEYRVTTIITRCVKCGQIQPIAVQSGTAVTMPTGLQTFADLIRHVHQGILPADTALEAEDLTDEQRRQVADIIPCKHPKDRRKIIRCCHGGRGERCQACGRTSQNPAWFVLEHKETEEVDDHGT